MEIIIGVVLVFVVALGLGMWTGQTVKCPRCGIAQDRFRMPASLWQAMLGGWTCPKCGAEIDRRGNPRN
ncbi:MAG: hypothetical protein F9K44_16965 [Hyphomicrobiaceae bacterium]|jgi:predicted RNA-binding Zn-ribbon protein involved in translation (DUF1610 family)|nr:MAG: hypothetical protein F9K44_16965 [Hyphomicrobiaceae bacterium]